MKERLNFDNRKGSTAVVVLSSLIFIVIASASGVDIGSGMVEEQKLKAFSVEMVKEGANALLYKDNETTKKELREKIVTKDTELKQCDIVVSDSGKEVTLYLGKQVSYPFLRLLGFSGKQIKSVCTAKLLNVAQLKNVKPIGIIKNDFIFNKELEITIGNSDLKHTQFIPLSWGQRSFSYNLKYGNNQNLNIGSELNILPKEKVMDYKLSVDTMLKGCYHKPQCTFEKFDSTCTRIMTIPVVEMKGEKAKVLGFSAFFISDYQNSNDFVLVKGRFIKLAINAEGSDGVPDFGVSNIEVMTQQD